MSLIAMTFNIRCETKENHQADNWGHRKNSLAQAVSQSGAHLIGMQEVTPKQLTFLRGELTEYESVGLGREKYGGEHSPLFFKKNRFAVLRNTTTWLSDNPHQKGSKFEGAKCPRVVTCAHLQDLTNGAELVCFVTHLDHVGMHGAYQIQREQAKLLLKQADAFCAGKDLPRIVMGDLNSPRHAGAPPVFLANDYQDCSASFRDIPTFVGFDGKHRGHIDWIFVRGMHIDSYKVYDGKQGRSRNISDHLPIAATLKLKRGEKRSAEIDSSDYRPHTKEEEYFQLAVALSASRS